MLKKANNGLQYDVFQLPGIYIYIVYIYIYMYCICVYTSGVEEGDTEYTVRTMPPPPESPLL